MSKTSADLMCCMLEASKAEPKAMRHGEGLLQGSPWVGLVLLRVVLQSASNVDHAHCSLLMTGCTSGLFVPISSIITVRRESAVGSVAQAGIITASIYSFAPAEVHVGQVHAVSASA
ncbi:hypothetical protein BaRGS_00016207 [Batillaria attramentaria]|uniref:Uncharacterized protein n=1 Tax=Batillaria attramentaria TaxID=370345 RepID=A0ABD0KZK4_9CAEN